MVTLLAVHPGLYFAYPIEFSFEVVLNHYHSGSWRLCINSRQKSYVDCKRETMRSCRKMAYWNKGKKLVLFLNLAML